MRNAEIFTRLSHLGPEWGFRLHFHGLNAEPRWTVNINNGTNWFPVSGQTAAGCFEEAFSRAEAFVKEGVR